MKVIAINSSPHKNKGLTANIPVEKHIVPGGDHMCSATMMDREIPFMLSWIKKKL